MASNTFDIDFLLKIYGASPNYRPQFEHRVTIVKSWNILPGSRILEIGSGQGDCTIVLAAAAGESGRVDAVDPAPLSYGMPYLLPCSHVQFPLLHQRYLTFLLRLACHNWSIPSPSIRISSRSSHQLDRGHSGTLPLYHHIVPRTLHTHHPFPLPLVLLFTLYLSLPPAPPPRLHNPEREPLHRGIRPPSPLPGFCATRARGSDFSEASS